MGDTKLRNVPEVVERLGVSPATVRRLIKDGRIRAVRIGTRVLVSEAEIDRLASEGSGDAKGQEEQKVGANA